MGKKKPSKRKRSARAHATEISTSTVSSDESHPLRSARQSMDGTFSPTTAASDGAQTAMTSIAHTDECTSQDMDVDDEDDQDGSTYERDNDDGSLYAASHYPGVASSFRTEMPFVTGIGGSSKAASTRSLWAQDLDYRDIHGRRYCRDYFIPIDEMELMRQALVHQVFLHVLDGELTNVPLDKPKHILDVGSGTGDWAIRLAEMYPNCEVVGTDIAAVAETSSVPMNVFFEIEDAEDWDRSPDFYDLVHFRAMDGAFRDWDAVYANVFQSLKPGGWIEVQDIGSIEAGDNFVTNFMPGAPAFRLMNDLKAAQAKCGRHMGSEHLSPRRFMDAGFVDVRVTEYLIPVTVAEKSAGKIWLISCLDSFEAICLRLLTEQMGWDPEECKAVCEQSARAFANLAKDPVKSKGLSVKMRVVVARKPLDAPLSAPVFDGGPLEPARAVSSDETVHVEDKDAGPSAPAESPSQQGEASGSSSDQTGGSPPKKQGPRVQIQLP